MSINILLADDSITIQKVIGIIFGGEDYSLTVVDNGKAAVEKARELLPDVLLIDALMPGMNGYEVCEAIRSIPSLATKPILLLTGSFEPFDEAKARSCGADDFIAKPFESQQIVSKVKELFEAGASRAAVAPVVAPAVEPASPAATLQPAAVEESAWSAAPAEVLNAVPAPPAPETAPALQPADIWGAFTPAEPPPTPPVVPSSFSEPDVFAMVSEEPDAQMAPAVNGLNTRPTIGSHWVPVEEQTFEFQEEAVAELPPAVFSEPSAAEPAAFGDIAFEQDLPTTPASIPEPVQPLTDTPTAPAAPAFETPIFETPSFESPSFDAPVLEESAPVAPAAPAFVPEPAAPAAVAAVAAAAPVALTEEQLKAALAGVSKDVIERIVWEVVPDLAETLIRDAIRKIREGI